MDKNLITFLNPKIKENNIEIIFDTTIFKIKIDENYKIATGNLKTITGSDANFTISSIPFEPKGCFIFPQKLHVKDAFSDLIYLYSTNGKYTFGAYKINLKNSKISKKRPLYKHQLQTQEFDFSTENLAMINNSDIIDIINHSLKSKLDSYNNSLTSFMGSMEYDDKDKSVTFSFPSNYSITNCNYIIWG